MAVASEGPAGIEDALRLAPGLIKVKRWCIAEGEAEIADVVPSVAAAIEGAMTEGRPLAVRKESMVRRESAEAGMAVGSG